MLATTAPFTQYFDSNGDPLDGGSIYFGQPNQNPETAPISVYWDAAGTQPAAHPIKTMNGYTVRGGTVAPVYVGADYSVAVRNKRGKLVLFAASSAAFSNDQALQNQLNDLSSTSDVTNGDALIGVLQPFIGAVARTQHQKNAETISIGDTGGLADNATDCQVAFANVLGQSKEVHLAEGIYRVATGNLSLAAKQRISGEGRELTFVRNAHATNDTFASTAQFNTYEHFTIDRVGAVAGSAISQAGTSNTAPLEGFVARHINANGHAYGVKLRDFVVALIADSYLQQGTRGLDIDKTGSNFCTILDVHRCWIRGNTDYGAYVAGTRSSYWEHAVFEGAGGNITNVGLYLSGGGSHVLQNPWFESLKQAAQFVSCGNVVLRDGYWDGGQMTASQAFYVNGAGLDTTVVFEGAWEYSNHTSTFATADQGATIIVRSPSIGGLQYTALNGGKVIFDYELIGVLSSFDPASLAAGGVTTQNVSVTGASVGDIVECFFDNTTTDPRLFHISGVVTAPNTVGVLFKNLHTSTLDLSTGVLTVRVKKKPLFS